MALKVCLLPSPDAQPPNNGIGRVIHAQYAHLGAYDIELVRDPNRADVIAEHTTQHNTPRVDVLHLHGIYWRGDPDSGHYDNWHDSANKDIVRVARKSLLLTVPSDWTARCWQRDMRVNPHIIPHGVDSSVWQPSTNDGGYILWNKNRPNDVCDPSPAYELAARGFPVISTFAPKNVPLPDMLSLTGEVPENEMQSLVSRAHLYLATTKETFGIGTLEAMSCAIPIVGFDWGGTRDLIMNDVEGVLVRPYDYDALVDAAHYAHTHRKRLGEAARVKAQQYTWERACAMYADVYREAYALRQAESAQRGVAIVVTSYNYGAYLSECLRSLLAQTVKPSEVIVVDDCSTDETTEIANDFAQRFALEGIAYTTIRHAANAGVAAARNDGVARATVPYVTCLDADDRLHPLYVAACAGAFRDRAVGLAYPGLGLIRADGRVTENAWPGQFDWEWQAGASVPPHTCIPTAAMFRRSAWERCGGYKQKYAPGEDAEFYTRLLSCGYTAVKVTESPLIEYRNHGQGAHTRPYVPIDDDKPWMRDRQYPIGAPSERPPLVRSYSDPLISVYIEWGTLPASLTIDSLIGQTWREWEIVAPQDYGTLLREYPFLRTQKSPSSILCVRVRGGEVLAGNFLSTELNAFIARADNSEWNGGELMGSCCGGRLDATYLAKLARAKQGEVNALEPIAPVDAVSLDSIPTTPSGLVRLEFIGRQVGAATYNGKPNSGRSYRAGNNDLERYINVQREDAEFLLAKGVFRLVNLPRAVTQAPAQQAPAPAPITRPLTAEEELVQRPVREVSHAPMDSWPHRAGTMPAAQDAPAVPSGRVELQAGAETDAPVEAPAVSAVGESPQEVSDVPAKWQRVQLPPELAADEALIHDEPISVKVTPRDGEDAGGYDARVRAAVEAERKRRAGG